MTEPLDVRTKWIYRETAAGAAVPGKALADFAFLAAYKTPAGAVTAWTHSSSIVDVAAVLGASYNGIYAWSYTMPPQESDAFIWPKPATGSDLISIVPISGEMEGKDLMSIFNAANRPVVIISGEGTIGQVVALTLVAKRYRKITFSFTNEDGSPIDMTIGTTYTNYTFSVRGKTDQTLTPPKYDQVVTNIAAGSGFVEVTILEAASFFSALTEGAAVADSYEARYELTADLVAVPNETVPVVASSPLFITRREVGT